MILFLYGKDDFRSTEHLHKMIDKFRRERDRQQLNVVEVDMLNRKTSELLEQIMGVPFLAEKKMIIVKNLLISKQPEGHEKILDKIENHTIPENNIVIFWESTDTFKTKAAKALFERLLQEKFSQNFEILTGPKLDGWVAVEIEGRGAQIKREAISYLTRACGANTWKISSTLEQVIAFADGEEIEIKHIMPFVEQQADENIFHLVDAIVSNHAKPVYKMIEQQYRAGKNAGYVVAMLIREIKILLQMRDLFEREDIQRSEIIAKRIGVHPYVAKKSLVLVKKISMKDLKKMYKELLAIDEQSKTGQGDLRLLLDLFIAKKRVQ